MPRKTKDYQRPAESGRDVRAKKTDAPAGRQRSALAPAWRAKWLLPAALFVTVILVYQPAWNAGFNWDDDWHITANPCIVGPLGFKELWTTKEAKICPLVQTTFWLEHEIWGFDTTLYHLVNILLHAVNALLLWRVLERYGVPGAGIGAAIWALHPVQVESVAWITELKNVQSGFFFLLSILFFGDFILAQRESGPRRSVHWYWASFVCAALAIASKSSTVVLPLVLALCAWWLDGMWRWGRVWNLLPFIPLSAAGCALSVWTQWTETVGKVEWVRSWPERIAVAGDVIWFYLAKLVWPHPLIFIYPRWKIDTENWQSYLPTAAVIVTFAVLWVYRRTLSRGPFFAFTYFVVALLPVLGLVNHYFIRYSFVGDHFQFLASMGIAALAGAAIIRLADCFGTWRKLAGFALCLAVLLPLVTISWRQSQMYANVETLYNTTLALNPDCWLAHYNLAHFLEDRGDLDPAIAHFRKVVEMKPTDYEPRVSLGSALLKRGEADAALEEYRKTLEYTPNCAMAYYNIGRVWAARRDSKKALENYNKALDIEPKYAEAHNNLGALLAEGGQITAAIAEMEQALALKPDYPLAHLNLAMAFAAEGRPSEARAHYGQALAQARAHNDKAMMEFIRAQFAGKQ
jgi:tetratricopeptide (TPR) repeat protein